MDYLQQAKTFLTRAQDAENADDRAAHLKMGIEMLEKAVAEYEQLTRPAR